MRTARVTFEDGQIMTTSINGTDKEIKDYYKLGNVFNLGKGDQDYCTAVKECEVLPQESSTKK